jgi:hypothetical protein
MSWQCLDSGVSGTTCVHCHTVVLSVWVCMSSLPLCYTPSLNVTTENQWLSIQWWIETVRLSGCHDSALILASQVLLVCIVHAVGVLSVWVCMSSLPLFYTPSLNVTTENQWLSIQWWIETVRLTGCHDSALILESQVLLVCIVI